MKTHVPDQLRMDLFREGLISQMLVTSEGVLDAPSDRVYRIHSDYCDQHSHILPPAFTDFTGEKGGVGEGTSIRFQVSLTCRTESFHQRLTESQPGPCLSAHWRPSRWFYHHLVVPSESEKSFLLKGQSGAQISIHSIWLRFPGLDRGALQAREDGKL